MCREHMLAAFHDAFLAFEHDIVACAPYLSKHSDRMYPYFPLARFKEYSFRGRAKLLSLDGYDNSDVAIVSDWLADIAIQPCHDCGQQANILYFPLDAISYSGSGPEFDKFRPESAEHLCRVHALDRVLPALANNPHRWDENGVVVPHEGPGIYVSTML